MSNPSYDLSGDEHLPPTEGPKLWPFQHRHEPIEFLALISLLPGTESDDSGDGGHAHVFRVRINGSLYALKVFKFCDIDQLREEELPFHNGDVDSETMIYQSDPFFAECRAYGRIAEIQSKRRSANKGRSVPNIAVPCYGYMGLSSAPHEEMFRKRFNVVTWNRHRDELDQPPEKRRPFRAIVKELVEGSTAVVNPAKMCRDLIRLQKGGVLQQDVFARNYLNGLLVDFSVAWTKPHWAMTVLSPSVFAGWAAEDLAGFDEMIEESGVKTSVRASKSLRRYAALRPLPSRQDI